jgi:hypothetical protein
VLKKSAYQHMCADYATNLIHWYTVLGEAKFVSFMCDSVAARLGDPDFTDILEKWRSILGDTKFVTFLSDSVTARLGDQDFTDILEKWRSILGDSRFATIIGNSVAARLGDPNFTNFLDTWFKVIDTQAFITLFSRNGVSVRYQVLGGFMGWYASNHMYWTAPMTEELCRVVPNPKEAKTLVDVPPKTWLGIIGPRSTQKMYRARAQSRKLTARYQETLRPAPVPQAAKKEEWPALEDIPELEHKLLPSSGTAPLRMLFRRVGMEAAIPVRAMQEAGDIVFFSGIRKADDYRVTGTLAAKLPDAVLVHLRSLVG